MKWDYEELLKESENKHSAKYEIAKVYVATHNKEGALRNVAKWYDYCVVKGLHPFESDRPMPDDTTELNVLLHLEREEQVAANRKFGKGGLGYDSRATNKNWERSRNDKAISDDWGREARAKEMSLSEEDRKEMEQRLLGHQKVGAIVFSPDKFRSVLRTWSLDPGRIRGAVKKFKIGLLKKQSPVKAIIKSGNVVKKKGETLSQRLSETSSRILSEAEWAANEIYRLSEQILHPVAEPAPVKAQTQQPREQTVLDLSVEEKEKQQDRGL